jgi:hypothetical protein
MFGAQGVWRPAPQRLIEDARHRVSLKKTDASRHLTPPNSLRCAAAQQAASAESTARPPKATSW